MKIKILGFIFVVFACVSIGNAGITAFECADDGDGVIDCTATLTGPTSDEYTLTIDGIHDLWDSGHMDGSITTDGDPTIKVINSIDNDTDFAWTDYHINVYMSQVFSIVADSAYVMDPADWTAEITAVAWDDVSGKYKGSIDYYAGSSVDIGETLDFVYKINYTYTGTTTYCQEMTPTPEPSTFVLLLLGLLGLGIAKSRFM